MSDYFQNKNEQNFNQENAKNQKVKLRLRLKSGEEFEAEGSLPFVLAQKEDFLSKNAPYLNKTGMLSQQPEQDRETAPKVFSTPQNNSLNTTESEQLLPEPIKVTPAEYNLHIPAIRRRKIEVQAKPRTSGPAEKQFWQIDEKIWSKIAYLDGTNLILRRKIKDLKPGIAALITLAAAKMLAGITKMSALELSKSLKMSGYLKGGERLDRILTSEIKAGTLFFEGSKRKRDYMISQTGTAKAYTSAEHFLL